MINLGLAKEQGRAQFKLQLITAAAGGSERCVCSYWGVHLPTLSCVVGQGEELSTVPVAFDQAECLLGHAVLLPSCLQARLIPAQL